MRNQDKVIDISPERRHFIQRKDSMLNNLSRCMCESEIENFIRSCAHRHIKSDSYSMMIVGFIWGACLASVVWLTQ